MYADLRSILMLYFPIFNAYYFPIFNICYFPPVTSPFLMSATSPFLMPAELYLEPPTGSFSLINPLYELPLPPSTVFEYACLIPSPFCCSCGFFRLIFFINMKVWYFDCFCGFFGWFHFQLIFLIYSLFSVDFIFKSFSRSTSAFRLKIFIFVWFSWSVSHFHLISFDFLEKWVIWTRK